MGRGKDGTSVNEGNGGPDKEAKKENKIALIHYGT
jgi:hypothetical protein